MRINIGSKVYCEGEQVGTVRRLILDPVGYDLRGVVVDLGGLLTSFEVLVPIERVSATRENTVTLDMTVSELKSQPRFEEKIYVSLDRIEQDAKAGGPLKDIEPVLLSSYFIPQVPLPPIAPAIEFEKKLGPHEREITAGMEVYALGRKVGEISEVIFDSCDKRAKSFILQRGWLFAHNVELPADWIQSIEADRIILNRTKEQVEELDHKQRQSGSTGGGKLEA